MHLINNPLYKEILGAEKTVVLDGGARGRLFSPFDKVNPDHLLVIRFEADPDAGILRNEREIIINKALWKEKSHLEVHIARNHAASSILKPDKEILSQFVPEIGYEARQTDRVLQVEGEGIDSYFEAHNIPLPDFIKLDIHGCEFEALEGAKKALATSVVGALVETWTLPVHQSQKTHAAVEDLLNQYHFYLFGQKVLGRWKRKMQGNFYSEEQIVPLENLYFQHLTSSRVKGFDEKAAVKIIAITELFGYVSYALQLNELFYMHQVLPGQVHEGIHKIIMSHQRKRPLKKYLKKIVARLENYLSSY